MPTTKTKKIKAWTVIDKYDNYTIATWQPAFASREQAREVCIKLELPFNSVVHCTISYQLPSKRK